MANELTQWVLVAGTGRVHLPPVVNWTAGAAGRALARAGYGLVVGGWSGVDYVTAESFQTELFLARKPLSSYLTQVVRSGWQPEFKGGHVVYVQPGPLEWVEAVKYVGAVILVGGIGGTYETYLYATQELRPVFPLAGTDGDARRAFADVLARWDALAMEGISKKTFASVLGNEIFSEQDAEQVIGDLIPLLRSKFSFTSTASQRQKGSVFVSYSHQDKKWLDRVRVMLKPLERKGNMSVWADTEIEAGVEWREAIRAAVTSARVAVFLVSPLFLLQITSMSRSYPSYWARLMQIKYELSGCALATVCTKKQA